MKPNRKSKMVTVDALVEQEVLQRAWLLAADHGMSLDRFLEQCFIDLAREEEKRSSVAVNVIPFP